jgi:hypothetical protein
MRVQSPQFFAKAYSATWRRLLGLTRRDYLPWPFRSREPGASRISPATAGPCPAGAPAEGPLTPFSRSHRRSKPEVGKTPRLGRSYLLPRTECAACTLILVKPHARSVA